MPTACAWHAHTACADGLGRWHAHPWLPTDAACPLDSKAVRISDLRKNDRASLKTVHSFGQSAQAAPAPPQPPRPTPPPPAAERPPPLRYVQTAPAPAFVNAQPYPAAYAQAQQPYPAQPYGVARAQPYQQQQQPYGMQQSYGMQQPYAMQQPYVQPRPMAAAQPAAPAASKIACHKCKKHFGVPPNTKIVACPFCQTHNRVPGA